MSVLFVHGLFPSIFDPPAGWLCPDLPGYGLNLTGGAVSLLPAVEFLRGLITTPVDIVGHSIGGAIAVLLAAKYPECVSSVTNVEGNFTLKDAFWSSRLAAMTEAEATTEIAILQTDPERWLTQADVPVTAGTLALAKRSLANSYSTIQAMARSVIEITSQAGYFDQVCAVLDHGIPFHLVAGERSLAGWDVPDFVLARAASLRIQPNAGHMLMWNDLAAFVLVVEGALG